MKYVMDFIVPYYVQYFFKKIQSSLHIQKDVFHDQY
jgi:hypothetical protein